ncbi:mitochondrial chaperone bcs1 [Moniliophthora roreri]|nr:mitochondrial chaperone bcs1 [Moniliophthora roreri]
MSRYREAYTTSANLDVQQTWSSMSWFPFVGLASIFSTLLASSPVFSSAKLLVIGSLIETGRRLFQWLVERFRFQYSMTAQFDEGDPSYEWVVHFLTQQKVWRRSREFRVSAKSSKRKWAIHPGYEDIGKDNADYVPTYELPQIFRWNGYWLEIKRTKGVGMPAMPQYGMQTFGGTIFVTIYSLNIGVLSDFVEEARRSYLEVSKPDVIIHMADTPHYNPGFTWTNVKRKVRRPLSSIILQEGVIQSLVQDAQEFLDTEDWYVQRGIPHRRGYLLHGPPGSGKSSTIYALAGELGLEIYSLSLASGFVDDSFLQRAASSVPKRSIFLIEDIDCAFSRDDPDSPLDMLTSIPGLPPQYVPNVRRSAVTLSGLLNVIDGVGSDEGKLFFATTNYIDRLDPALLRPGRIDRKIQYTLATQAQAAALFTRFFSENRSTSSNHSIVKTETSGKSSAVVVEKTVSLNGDSADDDASVIKRLSEIFASAIQPNEFTTAELQGYLLSCKKQPLQAVNGILAWIEQERIDRRERKEREEAKRRKAQERHDNFMKASGRRNAREKGRK